jgi:hypothetical protein
VFDPDLQSPFKHQDWITTLPLRESQWLRRPGFACRLRAKVEGLAAHISHAMLADEGLWAGGGLMEDVAACLSLIRQHERERDLRPVSTALLTLAGSRQAPRAEHVLAHPQMLSGSLIFGMFFTRHGILILYFCTMTDHDWAA